MHEGGEGDAPPVVDGPEPLVVGTRTSEKKTSLKRGAASHLPQRADVDARRLVATTNIVSPRCFGFSGSVRARGSRCRRSWAPEVQTF